MEKPEYTRRQMEQMIDRTRSWTLNNPSGPLPYLPVVWCENVSYEENIKAMNDTLPPYKSPNRVIKFLIWLKII